MFSPKREISAWHLDVKITSCVSNKNLLFTGLEGSKEWDCLLGRLVLVCKGMYTVPVKNVFLFLLVSCLLLLFLPYFIDLMCFLPKLIPQVIDQSFKKNLLDKCGNWEYSLQRVSGEFVYLQYVQSCRGTVWMWSSRCLNTSREWTADLRKPVWDLVPGSKAELLPFCLELNVLKLRY